MSLKLVVSTAAAAVAVALISLTVSVVGSTNFLLTGDRLVVGQNITYDTFTLTLKTNGDLVLLNGSRSIWRTRTNGYGSKCYVTLSDAGVLAVNWPSYKYPVWQSKPASSVTGRFALVLRYDGTLAIYGPVIWEPAAGASTRAALTSPAPERVWETTDSVLYSGDVAPIGTTVVGGGFKLVLQEDCNLVLGDFTVTGSLWSSGKTAPWKDCFVNLESSGQLRVKYLGGAVLWDNEKSGESDEYVLILGKGGDLAVYGPRLWNNVAGRSNAGEEVAAPTEAAEISMVTARSRSV